MPVPIFPRFAPGKTTSRSDWFDKSSTRVLIGQTYYLGSIPHFFIG